MPDMAAFAHPRRHRPLAADFFARPADRVARDLLGAWLVMPGPDGRPTRHVVFETEAYLGAHDLACHGSKGMTPRNETMFGPAGRWYVYLCYGVHWMLNVVTGGEGVPAAVSAAAMFARLYLLPVKRNTVPDQVLMAPAW